MNIQYNHKGKYFTKIQTKTPVKVIIQTINCQIKGTIHVHPDRRLLDELNEPQQFVAITEVSVSNNNHEMTIDFVALQKEQILWVAPIENPNQDGENGR
jgi:hypothetical protein